MYNANYDTELHSVSPEPPECPKRPSFSSDLPGRLRRHCSSLQLRLPTGRRCLPRRSLPRRRVALFAWKAFAVHACPPLSTLFSAPHPPSLRVKCSPPCLRASVPPWFSPVPSFFSCSSPSFSFVCFVPFVATKWSNPFELFPRSSTLFHALFGGEGGGYLCGLHSWFLHTYFTSVYRGYAHFIDF